MFCVSGDFALGMGVSRVEEVPPTALRDELGPCGWDVSCSKARYPKTHRKGTGGHPAQGGLRGEAHSRAAHAFEVGGCWIHRAKETLI